MYSIFVLSANNVSGGNESRVNLVGTDSPVRADSSTLHCHDSVTLISAGTLRPSSTFTKSPGTSSVVLISYSTPSLQTTHREMVIFLRAPISCSALFSCQNPKNAFAVKTNAIKIESPGLSGWMAKASIAAPMSK